MTPPPVIVTKDPAPCALPALPGKFQLVGMPDAQGIYITKTDIADLAGYLLGLGAWIEAAQECLKR